MNTPDSKRQIEPERWSDVCPACKGYPDQAHTCYLAPEPRRHSELAERVREGLNPRGHHRLCRVNVPTEWSSECNCPRDEIEDGHAALDELVEQLEALRDAREVWDLFLRANPVVDSQFTRFREGRAAALEVSNPASRSS